MQYIIDIILALIIVLNTVMGLKKGLVKTVFGLASVIIAVVLAYIFGSSAASLLRTTKAYDNICDSTKESLSEYFEKEALENKEKAFENIGSLSFVKQLESMGVDTQKELERYSENLESSAKEASSVLSEKFAVPILEFFSNILGTILVFIVSLLGMWLLSIVLRGIFSLPFLRGLNKTGGFITGLLLGLFYAFLICMVVKSLIPCLPKNPVIFEGMENKTVLYGLLSKFNPIYILLVGKFFS